MRSEAVQVSYIHAISAPQRKLGISKYRQELFSYFALDYTYCPEI